MAGGAMAGYWLIGNLRIDRAPTNMITRAITQAKIGRSIKNFDMVYSPLLPAALTVAGAGAGLAAFTLVASVALTSTPGRTNWRPSVITRSPAFRPSSISHWLPTVRLALS